MFDSKKANIGVKISLSGFFWYGLAIISGAVAIAQSELSSTSLTAGDKADALMWIFFAVGLMQCLAGIAVMTYGVLNSFRRP